MFEGVQCSFCERYHFGVAHLVASSNSGIYICSQCVDDYYPEPPEQTLYKTGTRKKKKNSDSFINKFIESFLNQDDHVLTVRCSFCNKLHHQVNYLISNKNVTDFICNNCLIMSKNAIEDIPIQSDKSFGKFFSNWQEDLTSSIAEFSYQKQKHLLRQIEDRLDLNTKHQEEILHLLDLMLKIDNLYPKIEQRIILIKSEIKHINNRKSPEQS